MLATLVIGLREGLEASLIVGMIAAFLRRNGASLKPMWLGIAAAVLLSAGVGITLEIVSESLPQQQQEAMETIIGIAAVVIVSFMILWMSKNARDMKSSLETHAGAALKGGSVVALAGMAFLAVLREGVETAVFMVAAFQSSLSPLAAGSGAVIGLALAAIVGVLLFRGAIKINLGKFFMATGAFLVFVAAGLIMKSLRTAHEAGWLNIGQDQVLSLSWMAPNGSAREAILTGVFGIPNDPRVVEVLGWVLFLVPMLAFVLWPRKWKFSASGLPKFQLGAAGVLAVAAVGLAVLAPLTVPGEPSLSSATTVVDSGGTPAGTVSLSQESDGGLVLTASDPQGKSTKYALTSHGTEAHAGSTAQVYSGKATASVVNDPATVSAADLAVLNGGRIPVGIASSQSPGPFNASWQHQGQVNAWMVNGKLLDAANTAGTRLTLSGGGLTTSRTIVVNTSGQWQVPVTQVERAATELQAHDSATSEIVLWSIYLPIVLGMSALFMGRLGLRNKRQLRTQDQLRNQRHLGHQDQLVEAAH